MSRQRTAPAEPVMVLRGRASLSGRVNIIVFPRRIRHPATQSEIVADYRRTHSSRGPYRTPLPEDWRMV